MWSCKYGYSWWNTGADGLAMWTTRSMAFHYNHRPASVDKNTWLQSYTLIVFQWEVHLENGVPLLQHNLVPPVKNQSWSESINAVQTQIQKYRIVNTFCRFQIRNTEIQEYRKTEQFILGAGLCSDQFLQVSNCVVLVAFDPHLNNDFNFLLF